MSTKQIQSGGGNAFGANSSGHPDVRDKAPGPQAKQVNYKSVAQAPAPSKGQTARGSQSGSTSPKTDGGGGMGNSSDALHRKIFGK